MWEKYDRITLFKPAAAGIDVKSYSKLNYGYTADKNARLTK